MRRPIALVVALVGMLAVAASTGCGASGPWPESTPEAEGLDPDAFERWVDDLESRGNEALLVLRNGKLLHESYGRSIDFGTPKPIASIAKGVVGGLALTLLAHDGALDLDAPASRDIAAWRADPQRRSITLRQLAGHASGLMDAPKTADDPEAWGPTFWRLESRRTPMHIALEETPLAFAPGEGYAYSNPAFAVLSVVLGHAFAREGHAGLEPFLRERIFAPIGIPRDEFALGYGRRFDVDGVEATASWGGAHISPGALARIGMLLLRRGDWEGERVIAPEAIEAMVRPAGALPRRERARPDAVLGWWSNAGGRWPELPRDAFLAWGRRHRVVLVVPSLDLVVVRLGRSLEEGKDRDWESLHRVLIAPLMEAFPKPPVPRSDVVDGAWWDPADALACDAVGSDNWPITWTREGDSFTSYGDGWGFAEPGAFKLSQGFARIAGPADAPVGRNVRSDSGERDGDGPKGAKASGLIAVDGVLYMFSRNLANSQLAWSEDGGTTWEWGFRFEESFGSPTFANFGPDYAGARDDFVYLYTQDGPSAYEADDRMVLARVPRDAVRDRSAYTFFAGMKPDGTPRFSPEFAERTGIFDSPGACRRSEVVYNPALGRYLLALGYDALGGWGIFEAPEPWGPWQTVYHTRRWDLDDTHSYRLPAAWIDDDGHGLHAVISGRDKEGRVRDGFCVRGLRLVPSATAVAP